MSRKQFYMQNKKPLLVILVIVAVLGAYVLNGNTFNNLWRNLTASLGGYNGILNPGDKVIESDSTTITYEKKLRDTTGAVYGEVTVEKKIPASEQGTLTTINGVPYTESELANLPKSEKTVDMQSPIDSADADGLILVLKGDPILKERGKGLALGKSKEELAQIVTSKKSEIAQQHTKVKAQIESKLKKKLNPGHAKKSGEINSVEFDDVLNAIVLMDVPVKETKEKLKGLSDIQSIEPNLIAHADLPQSVPQIHADQVWSHVSPSGNFLTGVGMRIGVIDTGVDYTHPDLGGCFGPGCKVVGGYDFVNNDSDPMDDHGHGTHVSGTIAGNGTYIPTGGTNVVPIVGVAPGATLYAYKVLDSAGSGPSNGIIQAMQRCVDPNQDGNYSDHLDVCSMSLGANGGNPDDSMSTAVDNAVSNGVVFTIAAGNSGLLGSNSIGSPGTSRKAITVAAACKTLDTAGSCAFGPIANFSSRGPVVWTDANGVSQTLQKPDIAAPGVNICAAQWANAWASHSCGTGHTAISGTSMATPHMAGVAALLREAHPEYAPQRVKDVLMQTAAPYSGVDQASQGSGLVDAFHAQQVAVFPQSDLSFTGDLPLLMSDPVTLTTQTIVKNITVGNLTNQTLAISPSVSGLSAGVNVSYSYNGGAFTLATGGTQNLTVTFTIDNTLVASPSILTGNLTFAYTSSSGAHTLPLGFVINVGNRLSVAPQMIDFGFDPTAQASWTSTSQVSLTNTLTNAQTTYTVSSSCCGQGSATTASGITLTPSAMTVTIPAGGTANLSATVSATNASLPNGRYKGYITLTSSLQTLRIPITFFKGYGLRLNYGGAGVPTTVMLYQNTSSSATQIVPSINDTSTLFYVSNAGPWSAVGFWQGGSTFGTYVGKDSISLGALITDVSMVKTEALYTVQYIPKLPNGNSLSAWSHVFQVLPVSTSSWYMGSLSLGSVTTSNAYFRTNTMSAVNFLMAANSIYQNVPIVFDYQSTAISQNTNLTNTSNDFKVKHLAGFPNNGASNIQFGIYNVLNSWTASPAWKIQASAATPVDLYTYSNDGIPVTDTTLADHIPSFFVGLFDQNVPLQNSNYYYVTQGQTYEYLAPGSTETGWGFHNLGYQYFKVDSAPSDMINIGLGPMIPFSKTYTTVQQMWAYLRSNFYGPSVYQYSGGSNDYKDIPYTIKNSAGTTVASGTWATGENTPSPGLTYVSGATNDTYRFELTGNPTINTTPTSVTTTQKFPLWRSDGSLPPAGFDPNPPIITELHLLGNGLWQQVIDPAITNTLIFKADPSPPSQSIPPVYLSDSISSVLLEQTTDGITWTSIPTTFSLGQYQAVLPTTATQTLYTYRLTVTDAASNTIVHQFQIPKGTAMNPPVTAPFPIDATPPTISVSYPNHDGVIASGTVFQFQVSVSDNIEISHVDFYLNGTLLTSGINTSYSIYYINIDPTAYPNGPYTLTARAYDTSNNSSVASRNIAIDNGNYGTTCLHQAASATITPISQTGAPGQGRDYAVTITNNNTGFYGTTCKTSTFSVATGSITLPGAGWTATVSPWALGIAPGATGIQTLTLTPPLSAVPGTYVPTNVYAGDIDAIFNSNSNKLSFNYIVNPSLDTTPPSISNITTSNITTTSGVISWTTNELSDTQVIYGTSSGSYPNTSFLNPTPATLHSVTVTPLTQGTHYYFKVESRDAAGNLAVSTPENTFTTATLDTTPPTVTLTAPMPGATVSGITAVSANASDNVGVDHVDFIKNGAIIGADATAPYSINWDTTTTANGTYGMTAKAYDASGNFTSSSAITVIVNNVVVPPPDTTPPTVSITSPTAGTTLTGTVTLSANANDNVGVTKVSFFYNGILIDTDTTGSPGFAIAWNTTTMPNVPVTLTAKAYDAAGNIGTSSSVAVTILNDTTPPAVTWGAPVTGSTLTGTVTMGALATDNTSITRVEFYRGTTLLCTDTTSPYNCSWDTTTVSNGTYSFNAKGYDQVGNVGVSASVSLVVSNSSSDVTAPVVIINTPTAGAMMPNHGNATITASATDASGIASIKIFIDGGTTPKKTCTSVTTCSYTQWNLSQTTSGTHTILVQAYDNSINHNVGTKTETVTRP